MISTRTLSLFVATAFLVIGARGVHAEFVVASDDANQLTYDLGFSIGSNGGSGFNSWTQLNSGGGTFIESGGRQVDGTRSFGLFAGGSGYAAGRELQSSIDIGSVSFTARHDLDNANAFSGFNLKNTASADFGNGELLSFGLNPGNNNSIFVTDNSGGSHSIDFGMELRGAILNYDVDFNTTAGTYTLSVTKDGTTLMHSGSLITSGAVASIGFGNFNSGSGQNLIFDNLQASVPEPGSLLLFCSIVGIAFRRRERNS